MDIIQDSRFINLYSRNASEKVNGSLLSSVTFNFKNILKESDDILYTQVGVFNAQIPISWYTIDQYRNVLKYKYPSSSSTISTISLTLGNYNSNSLITEMKTQFLANGHNFTINLNSINGKVTFSSTSNFSFLNTTNGSLIMDLLGFDDSVNYTSSSLSLTAIYPLNMLGIQRLKINSNALSTHTINSKTLSESNTIASIPVNASSFGLIQYENKNVYSLLRAKVINQIDIQIRDQDENLIDLNGIDWTMTLQIIVYRKNLYSNNNLKLSPLLKVLQKIDNDLVTGLGINNISQEQQLEQPISEQQVNENVDLPTFGDNDLDLLIYNNQLPTNNL
jgi:hypothetical protein